MYYRELSDGLQVLATEMSFQKSVVRNTFFESGSSDYYFLAHFRYDTQANAREVNGKSLPKTGWSFYKPGLDVEKYVDQWDAGVFVIFAFSKHWFSQHICLEGCSEQSLLIKYLNSDKSMMIWDDVVANSQSMTAELLATIKQNSTSNFNQLSLKIQVLKMIASFLNDANQSLQSGLLSKSNESDSRLLAAAENILLKNLTKPFPGIERIAEKVHMSPTKLKANFKIIYGKTLFQYYQEQQMRLALELLKEKKNSVKEVAFLLSYENPSNFRSAFKKYFDYVPSEIQ